jgi:transposase
MKQETQKKNKTIPNKPPIPPDTPIPPRRVIGLDAHPDSFTAAVLTGPTPLAAVTEKIFDHVPLSQLSRWSQKNTTAQDIIVLEASGNSFHIVHVLAAVERKALVLESCQMGKLKEAHANNDKISAVRIGKAYLSGTAKEVWVPDPKTQERRDLFHAHRKAVKHTTQVRNRIRSYLSDQGVRLAPALRLASDPTVKETIHKARKWTPRQWQVVEGMLLELQQADQLRSHWRSLIAQEVLADQTLMSLVRLCGVRDLIAFALVAIIGDVKRFSNPRKLVKYIGLNPAFDDSGKNTWTGGIGGHGRKDLRSLLIEEAQALMRTKHSMAKWGRKLMRRKSSLALAVAAVARKLTVAIWYLLMGRWTPLEEIEPSLALKVGKIVSQVGPEKIKALGKSRKDLREAAFETLKNPRIYVLYPYNEKPSKKAQLVDAVPHTP